MRIIAGPRKSSRTTRLIEMAAELEAKGEVSYILTFNHDRAYKIAQKAKEMNLNIGFPVTYDEFINGSLRGGFAKNILIDNADHFLQYLAGPISVVAIVVETEQIG